MFLLDVDLPTEFENQICVYAKSQLSSLGKSTSNKSADGRDQRVRTEALRIGAAIGSKQVWNVLMETLEKPKYTKVMDQMFNFSYLRYDWQMLPPVIQTADQSANLIGTQQLVTTDQIFEIISPARLITATPTWRSYLDEHKFPDAQPSRSLLPASSSENAIWEDGLCEGAKHGARFAIDEFADVMSRLTRDYKGMLLYKELELHGVVNAPKLESERYGVVQNGKTLVMNKTRYIIASQSQFQRPERWNRPVITMEIDPPQDKTPAFIQKPVVLEPEPEVIAVPAAPASQPAQPMTVAPTSAVVPVSQANPVLPTKAPVQSAAPAITINAKAKTVKLRSKKTGTGFFSGQISSVEPGQ